MASLTAKQASEYANASASLVYQWCADRRLPHLRLGRAGRRGKMLIEQSDLDKFLESMRVDVQHQELVEGLRHIRRR